MQTATQSYGANAYTQLHGASSFGTDPKEGSSSRQSADSTKPDRQGDSVKLSVKSKQLSQENDNNVVTADQKGTDQKPLSQEELNVLTELKSRDTEVRAHEQAHLSAAGGHATGGATFSYTTGPNGKRYASGGKVPIDTSTEDTPEATILKMRTIRRAALAPANPSSADRAIAAKVSSKETQAMKELQELDTMTAATPSAPSSGTGTEPSEEDKKVAQTTSLSGDSGYNHAIMASAYQAIADLGA